MVTIGEILRKRSRITEEQLNHALSLQKRSGSRLGDILIGEGIIGYYDLYQALSAHFGLPFVNLLKEPPPSQLIVDGIPPDEYLKRNLLPFARNEQGIFTIALSEYHEENITWCKQQFGADTRFILTSPFDIRHVIEKHFSQSFETASRLTLWQRSPSRSARVTIEKRQQEILYGIIAICMALIAFLPLYFALAIIIICHLTYAATMCFKAMVFARRIAPIPSSNWAEKLATLDENRCLYTRS